MTHPYFDRILAELRSYHRDPERRVTPDDLARRAADLGLEPGPAQLLQLQSHFDRLWQTVRSTGPSPSRTSLRPLLREIAHEALLTLLQWEEGPVGPRVPARKSRRFRKV